MLLRFQFDKTLIAPQRAVKVKENSQTNKSAHRSNKKEEQRKG